jgi:hypothetical protein
MEPKRQADCVIYFEAFQPSEHRKSSRTAKRRFCAEFYIDTEFLARSASFLSDELGENQLIALRLPG